MSAPARPHVVDSSGWLEYLADSAGAARFAPAVEDVARLVVPSVCLLEVFRKVLREVGEGEALQAVAVMSQGRAVDLDGALAVAAARLGARHKLPLADSVVYATAELVGGTVWTQDADFEQLPNVRFWPKATRT